MNPVVGRDAARRERGAGRDRNRPALPVQPRPEARPGWSPFEDREGLDAGEIGPAEAPASPRPEARQAPRDPAAGPSLARQLSSRAALRQAILLTEILGPPVALRPPGKSVSRR